VQRLLDLGSVPADVGRTGDEAWHVLADPEGSEFCLLQHCLDPLRAGSRRVGPGGSRAGATDAPRTGGGAWSRCRPEDDNAVVILIVVKFPVRPDRADEWVALAADYARSVNAEEGSLFFEWSRSLEDPETFVCVEGFRDADAGAAHVGTDAFKRFVEQAPELVAAQPQIIYVDAPDVPGWGAMGEIQPR
jgi:quinol monooxygenase YgiN